MLHRGTPTYPTETCGRETYRHVAQIEVFRNVAQIEVFRHVAQGHTYMSGRGIPTYVTETHRHVVQRHTLPLVSQINIDM